MVSGLAGRCGVDSVSTLGDAGDGSLMKSSGPGDEFDTLVSRGDDIAAIVYTSGTTGKPKGAALSHRNLASNAVALHATWGFGAGDVLLHALPLFHTHGLFVACHCSLLNATPMLLLPKFDPRQVIDLLPRASVFMGVPTFYTRLLADAEFRPGRQCGQYAALRLRLRADAGADPSRVLTERTGHTHSRALRHDLSAA